MIVDKNHPLFAEVELRDISGSKVEYVFSFDTETKLAKVFLSATGKDGAKRVAVIGESFTGPDAVNNKVATAEVVLTGARLYNRTTGEEVK